MAGSYLAPVWAWRARDIRLAALTGQVGTAVRAGTAIVTDMLGQTATLVNNQPRFQAIDTNADGINDALVFKGGVISVDYLQWPVPTLPVAATYYVRAVNRGAQAQQAVLLEHGFAAAPFVVLTKTTSNTYVLTHNNNVSSVTSTSAAVTSGQTLDLRCVLRATGVVQLYLSINGGAEVAATASGALALAAAWGDTLLALCGGIITSNSATDDIFAAGMWLGEQTLPTCQAML